MADVPSIDPELDATDPIDSSRSLLLGLPRFLCCTSKQLSSRPACTHRLHGRSTRKHHVNHDRLTSPCSLFTITSKMSSLTMYLYIYLDHHHDT